MNKKSFGSRLVAAPYLVWAAIFVIVPLLMMVYFAFTDNSGAWTLSNIANIGKYKKAFGVSILYAVIATAITLVISYPMAYFNRPYEAGHAGQPRGLRQLYDAVRNPSHLCRNPSLRT